MTSVVRHNHVRIVFRFVHVPIPTMHHHRVECYLLTVYVATLHLIVYAADIAFRKAHLNGMISFSLRTCWYCEGEGEITIFLHQESTKSEESWEEMDVEDPSQTSSQT